MDEIRIRTKFFCGLIAKVIEISLKKCCGIKTKIDLDCIVFTNDDGKAVIDMRNVRMEMKSEDLSKMIFGKLNDEEGV